MKLNRPSLTKAAELYRRLMLVLLLNAPVLWGILLLDVRGVKLSPLSGAYFTSVALGYYLLPLMLVVTAVFLLLFAARKVAAWVAGAAVTAFLYFLLMDSFVYDICKLHIDFFWLEFVFEDYRGLGLPTSTLLSALGALVLLVLLELGIFALSSRMRRPRRVALPLFAVAILAFGFSQVAHIVAYKRNDQRITSLTPRFPFYVPFTSHRNADKFGDLLPLGDPAAAAEALDPDAATLNFPLSPMEFSADAPADPPNILMILLESWRYDAMNEEVSPRIKAFADSSIVFRNHLSSGNSTTCGVFGLFYGIEATYWTAVKANSSLIDNPPLIDAMQDRGYAFGIYADSNFDRHKVKDTVFRGIEVHEDFEGRSDDQRDADLTRRLKGFLREQSAADRPFFAFAFYKSSHNNYHYPPEHGIFRPSRKLNVAFIKSKNPEYYKNDYLNAVHYSDELVGEVLDELAALGEMENTVILITTDHGDSFNDNGADYWGHGSNFTRYQVQVPLIVRYPGREAREVLEFSSHVDVPPTLLQEVFGCVTPLRDYSNGRNLFGDLSAPRPFVVGSYVNHAFIFEDDVFAIYPVHTRKYKFDDVNGEASRPHPQLLKQVMEEINRFYAREGR